jgi:hypothetical protein
MKMHSQWGRTGIWRAMALCGFLLGPACYGDTIIQNYGAGSGAGSVSLDDVCTTTTQTFPAQATSPSPVSLNSSPPVLGPCSPPPPPSPDIYTASAHLTGSSDAGIITLNASASATQSGPDVGGSASVMGSLSWTDLVTLSGLPQVLSYFFELNPIVDVFSTQGTQSLALLGIDVEANTMVGDSSSAQGFFIADSYESTNGGGIDFVSVSNPGDCVVGQGALDGLPAGCTSLSGQNGDQFLITITVNFEATASNPQNATNFANLEVIDPIYFNLDPTTPGASYTTASGINYQTGAFPPASSSPEPSSLPLVATGAAFAILRKRLFGFKTAPHEGTALRLT